MKKEQSQPTKFNPLDRINLNAAGLDVGAAEIWACVPQDRTEPHVRPFLTFTADLHVLADWLQACRIETVAMESTGVYWIPIYEILIERGLEVKLVNAQHLKNVPGRKSDVLDCQSPKGRRSALAATIAYLWPFAWLLSPGRGDVCRPRLHPPTGFPHPMPQPAYPTYAQSLAADEPALIPGGQ